MASWPRRGARFGPGLLLLLSLAGTGMAGSPAFVAPPRSVADIETILAEQKPGDERMQKLNAAATAELPSDADPEAQIRLYRSRAFASSELGRYPQAMGDLKKGILVGEENKLNVTPLRLELGFLHSFAGDNLAALTSVERAFEDIRKTNKPNFLFVCMRWLVQIHIYLSNLPKAEEYVRMLDAELERFRPQFDETVFDATRIQVEFAHARLFDARGQYREAEEHYAQAYGLMPAVRRLAARQQSNSGNFGYVDTMADNLIASAGRAKARQGRFAEGEVDVRQALFGRLNAVGKYNLTTARTLPYLSTILVEQGRYGEAERMTRVAIDIYRSLGVENNSLAYASNLSELGTILCLEEKWQDAANVYEELEKAIAAWDGTRRADLLLTPARVYMLYNTGRLAAGLEQARLMVHRVSERVGESHFDHAVARGVLAIGLFRSGHDAEAAKEFRAAVPFLTRVAVENDDDVTDSAARESYVRRIIESYIALSVRTSAAGDQATIAETFQLAESIRAHAVQKALVASALRMVARDGALADLIRKEQDLEKQLGAELGLLNNLLGLPSKQRDGAVVDRLTEQIATLRHEQANASAELKKRFPDYAEFVDPAPPTAADVQAMLRPRESFLSIYVGHDQSFVWAIPKEGALRLTALALPAAELEKTVVKLRAALEPQAAMISDIPPFDVALAFDLYARLLGPVEDGWRPSKSLIVVANGALGLLPLSLLPTAPSTIDIGDDPLFASYRNVPWLARTHAVTTVPSAAALRALRSLPATASGRSRLVAFGDPVFSSEQLQEAEQPVRAERPDIVAMRGAPLKRRNTPKLDTVDSAELAMLPRLPDTAEELRSIAAALKVDPATQVYLGRRADEQTVKTMDLSKYAIVAFATHGLVPGELNGLTQPALALSSPEVTGGSGDGLLTMDEILGLKLDADWVVLSACNTAAGSGAGAEAASGLGQAFFYAGTRAVLVTNWSVHSQSARELVTDLFRRQADDSAVTRSEALRRAMMALVDGPGYGGADGKTVFTYAHPLFWAPYTIIGDGG